MSTPKTHWKNDKQRGHGKDGEITLLFDGNRSMTTFKRALEALPPRLQLTLNECRIGGSMRLSKDSFDAWWFILQYAESGCPYSEFFNEINNECVETLVRPLILYQYAIFVCFIILGGSSETVSNVRDYISSRSH